MRTPSMSARSPPVRPVRYGSMEDTRAARTSSTRLSTWRRSRAEFGSDVTSEDAHGHSRGYGQPHVSLERPRRRRKSRTLQPPPSFVAPDPEASVTAFLSASALPRDVVPESTDTSFKAHAALIRRLTLHDFDLNRYLFVYKPLAKIHSLLTVQLLAETAQRHSPVSPLLRSAAFYVAANAHRSVYAMVLSCELKSAFKPRPAAEHIFSDTVVGGIGLSDQELAALDFVQELSSEEGIVSENTKRRVIDGSVESDGRLERVLAGIAAFVVFVSRLTAAVDFELSYESVAFASQNLQGLPWRPSGGHFLIQSFDDDLFGRGRARQRIGRSRRSARMRRPSSSRDRRSSAVPNYNRVSQVLAYSFVAPRMMGDVARAAESWMRNAMLPPPGRIFDMNDLIMRLWGFEPYFLSTSAMPSEEARRAFVLSAKELLFTEKEVPLRTKFLLCYVLSRSAEEARDRHRKESQDTAPMRTASSPEFVAPPQPEYDALAIMSAHAAYLACRQGATPAELRAATDVGVVRAACERAAAARDEGAVASGDEMTSGVKLRQKDVAVAALGHALSKRPSRLDARTLRAFENAFGSPLKRSARGGRACHRALLELIGASCLWGALERYAAAALAMDIDMSSYLMFGNGRAEPTITEFAQSPLGQEVGLSLLTDEVAEARARNEKAGRMSSLYYSGSSPSLRRATQRNPSLRRSAGSPHKTHIPRLQSLVVPPRRRSRKRM